MFEKAFNYMWNSIHLFALIAIGCAYAFTKPIDLHNQLEHQFEEIQRQEQEEKEKWERMYLEGLQREEEKKREAEKNAT